MKDKIYLDQLCINTLRTLAMDAVQKAESGHPGTPMGIAPMAYCLWQRFLNYAPDEPQWPNRDRFVLSAGHASALLYSLLHLCSVKGNGNSVQPGAAVTLDDLKNFRQAGSPCTGHPEYGWTSGVETTTGPLGQGLANSVGMAMAQCWLAATYNQPGFTLFDYNVYTLCSDGDMMEGVGSEAASLAGHLKLHKLCWIYDCNRITIEGSTRLAFSEDVATRFFAYGWNVTRVSDANDLAMLERSLAVFLATRDRPTLIIVDSHIGYGAPHKQDTKEAHGEPLGAEEVRLAKAWYGWDANAQFYVPSEVPAHFSEQFGQRGSTAHVQWQKLFNEYRAQYPQLAAQIEDMQRGDLPPGWDHALPSFAPDSKGLATRESGGKVLNAIAAHVPWLLGGAADLAPSTKTHLDFFGAGEFQAPEQEGSYRGRNFHFGVREHVMCAIASGLSLCKLRCYVASFFIFSDYCRAAIRLSAIMKLPVIYIWTHDSVALGEDGPTHQPVEHLASFRAMPGMITLRPADANEVVAAWRVIMHIRDGPVSLLLTRQAVPTLDRTRYAAADGVAMGAYILADATARPAEVLLLASGSEVALCIAAYEQLQAEGIAARVISMPCWELFARQSQQYRDQVLPPQIAARVAVEAASPFGWERYTGSHGAILGINTFGLSAPGKVVMQHYGMTLEQVVAAAKEQIARHAPPRLYAGSDSTNADLTVEEMG